MIELVILGAGSALELYAEALRGSGRQVLVCDLVAERAMAAAQTHGFQPIEAKVAAFPIGATVLNLTPPDAHGPTTAARN